jgi:hypothetical protein
MSRFLEKAAKRTFFAPEEGGYQEKTDTCQEK